jgi:hypothetical protein
MMTNDAFKHVEEYEHIEKHRKRLDGEDYTASVEGEIESINVIDEVDSDQG